MEERKGDRFESIIKFCKPTVSQEAKLRNCPLAREFENFLDSNPDPLSSSPEPTPSEPIGIIMVSLPDSGGNSVDRNSPREDDAVFHTPPEEQNQEESSSDGARSIDLNDRFGKKKRLRTSEGEMDGELISKKVKVWEELNSGTMPIDDTDMITIELDEIESVRNHPEIVDLVSTESGDEMTSNKLVEDSLEKIVEGVFRGEKEVEQRIFEETHRVVEKFVHELDAGNENDELMETCEYIENVKVNKGEMPHKNDTSYGTLGSSEVVGNGCVEMGDRGVGGDAEFTNITKDENAIKERHEDAGWGMASKSIEDIDKFRYVGDRDNGVQRNRRVGAKGSLARKRELPISMKGKEKNVEGGDVATNTVGTKTRLLKDFLNAFNLVLGDADDSCEDTDFLEIAKSQGMTFPRPRWWPSEGARISFSTLKNVIRNDNWQDFTLPPLFENRGYTTSTSGFGFIAVEQEKEGNNITKDENAIKERHEYAGWGMASKSIEDIDKFRYVGDRDNGGQRNRRVGAKGSLARKRELPISMKGKEKNVEGGDVAANTVGTKTRLLKDFLNAFNLVLGDADDSCEDTDFLEIAKSQGMTFPRPRWWPSEGDGEL